MRRSKSEYSLLRAVLADDGLDEETAEAVLRAAEVLGVDPLDHCMHRYGLGAAKVAARAARWSGTRFVASLPDPEPEMRAEMIRLDDIGITRSVVMAVRGRNVTFVAPQFAEVVELRDAAAQHPEIAERVAVATRVEVERVLRLACEDRLLDHARQELVRRWPNAAAAISLPLAVRATFALGLCALVAVVMFASAAGLWPVLPVIALLLLVPGLARLLAAVSRVPGSARRTPRLLEDAALPVYTVLVPLRGESHMVPLLREAMRGLDYPALCIKRTKRCGAA